MGFFILKLTLQDKLNIIDKNDSGIPMASLALEYSVGYTTVKNNNKTVSYAW